MILRNCRLPEWNLSDFNAIVAALRLAERRVHEICDRFGVDDFIAAMDEMLDRNKRAMGAIIQMVIPEKKAYFEDYIDDDGIGMGPYKIACTMWREGEKAIFDFAGTDPQSISSVNFLLNEEMFKMFLGAFFINLFDPQILFNDGFYHAGRGPHSAGIDPQTQKPRGAVVPHAFARPNIRHHGRRVGAGRARCAQCRRFLRQPALYVFGLRQER